MDECNHWIDCRNPEELLVILFNSRHPFATDRKLRLFACACVRRLFQVHTRSIYRSVIDTVEQVADGERRPDELEILRDTFGDNINLPLPRHVQAVRWLCSPSARNATRAAACVRDALDDNTEGCAVRQNQIHANLLRDILGNPFRPVVREDAYLGNPLVHQIAIATRREGEKNCIDRIVRHHWLTRDVIDVARGIYDERLLPGGEYDPIRLAILADALEEAGCVGSTPCLYCQGRGFHDVGMVINDLWGAKVTRERITCVACRSSGTTPHELVAHLRHPGPHVRGCWAIDLILGKE